ncbi:AtzH-like domain-containing protein [Kozakia baliensis]|uniref:AtzH-like domain-containing protein n=1 Tax=Kozakia baliensis TaxID=153496 RepID=UPI000B32424D|nr:AtzH-like domain-containing protein [Kozakia baliensis]GBR30503.1 hypothetical protein AA0488_2016 [Kozakia baliensis NRIC 0488]GEL63105.1 hypothetical protein KBA01_03910 [Kozakia baliensis]
MSIELSENTAAIAALTVASDQYEDALAQNNIPVLDELFFDGPEAVRFGATENLFGAQEIAEFRRARTNGAPARRNTRREIVALGPDVGCVNIVFERLADGRIGRQSQTWLRTAHGWRIVSAHVSLLPK